MSEFLNKSNKSYDAAVELLKYNDLFCASSVHCSYYSVLQHILHIVHEKLNITKSELALDNDEGSHVILLKKMSGIFDARREYESFKENVIALKKLRVKADYSNVIIELLEGQKAKDMARFLINNMKKLKLK